MNRVFAVTIVFITSIFMPLDSEAQVPETAFNKCKKEVASFISKWGGQGPWRKTLGDRGRIEHFSATNKLGVWIVMGPDSKESLTLQRIETGAVSSFTLRGESCKPEITVQKSPASKQPSENISDSTISKFLKDTSNGVIYVWSPAMPLSVEGLREIQAAAAAENFKILAVLDPNANLGEAKKLLASRKLPLNYATKSDSTELKFRGVYNHFPAALFFKDSKLSDIKVPGYKSTAGYRQEYKSL